MEFGSALAIMEGITPLVRLRKENLYLENWISYLKTAFHIFSSYSVVKSFNFCLYICAFFSFLTVTKVLFTAELHH